MGGFGKMPSMRTMTRKAPPVFDMTGKQKATLVNAQQASPYGNNGYPATNAFSNGSKFTHTNKGVGMWWKATFKGGEQWIW